MKVSLIIPAYNEEGFIGQCLDSVAAQQVAPDEVIVVNNNSTDRTEEIAKKYGNVRVVTEKVQGMIPARNRGFNEAKHEIIARCDADCILPPDWVWRIKQNFTMHPEIDGIAGTAVFYDFPIKNIRPIIANSMEQIKKTIGHYSFIGPCMIIRKKSWLNIKKNICHDERIVHEDVDLSIHLFESGGYLIYDNELVVQISARRLKRKPFEFLFEYPFRIVKTIQHHRSDIIFSDL
jgi:glycosyltransferase involved in cell wall biosynthesis